VNLTAWARGARLEAPGFLGWLRVTVVGLALAVAVTAAARLPGEGLRLPPGLVGVAWFLLLGEGVVWALRLADSLLSQELLEAALSLGAVAGQVLLLLGLASAPARAGLAGVFGLFLAAGEILHLIELRTGAGPARLREHRFSLPLRARVLLSAGTLAGYLLITGASLL
jgi:hypothetical protein